MSFIPFNSVSTTGLELAYVQEAFARMHISGDGIFTRNCQGFLEDELGVPKALLTTSCTHALEMAGLLLDLKPLDEIIIPAFTFVSTANAFVLRGAKPIFADIRPDTLNLDERLLPSLVTPKTKAIVPVHYAGVGCEMDAILDLAGQRGIRVIEDNAHGLFGRYRGKLLGSFGCLATQSFHETKNFSCGEGGALLINDPDFIERAEIIREKGTNRKCFFRGEIDKYTWVDIGSSYLPSDILSAVLFAQFEARLSIQEKRCRLWEGYAKGLADWAAEHRVGLPYVPPHCEQTFHMFYLRLPDRKVRDALIEHLKGLEILSVFHYAPLHLSAMGRRFGGYEGQCPVTEKVSEQIVRLPMYYGLEENDQNRILDAIHSFRLPEGGRIDKAGAQLSDDTSPLAATAGRARSGASS